MHGGVCKIVMCSAVERNGLPLLFAACVIDIGQGITAGKCKKFNLLEIAAEKHRGQGVAGAERTLTNGCHAVTDDHCGQCIAGVESVFSDMRYIIGDFDAC